MRFLELPDGPRLSRIGLGTWQFGSAEWGYGPDYAERTAGDIVRRALDLGINLLDTAEVYAFGRSERIVGEALAGRRDEAFVATKLFPVLPLPAVIEQQALASARRLGVQRIDLYQAHWPNPVVPIATQMAGMRRLVDLEIVGEVGVSHYPVDAWQAAERALGSRVLSNQVQYSLAARKAERDVLPYAAEAGRVVIAHSPLAQGLLADTHPAGAAPRGVRATNPLFLPENLERAAPLLATLRAIGAAHGATPAQVALAWVIRRPNIVAIPGASSVEQLEENAAAADLDLSDDEDIALTAVADTFAPVTGAQAVPSLVGSWLRAHA